MLAYESSGQGLPVVVLIHAFPLYSAMWKPQVQSLSRKNRVICADLPGFGRSACETEPSISKMAQELAELLICLNVKEPAVIAGLSMGGYVAFEFYRQFPERAAGLGLFSTRPGSDSPEAQQKRLNSADIIQKNGLEAFAKSTLSGLVGKTTQESKADVIRELEHMISANSREGVSRALRAMAKRTDLTGLLKEIKCPVLIIAGDEDTLIPFTESETMHSGIQGSQFHLLRKAGHLVSMEQPDAFSEIFEKFLAKKF